MNHYQPKHAKHTARRKEHRINRIILKTLLGIVIAILLLYLYLFLTA